MSIVSSLRRLGLCLRVASPPDCRAKRFGMAPTTDVRRGVTPNILTRPFQEIKGRMAVSLPLKRSAHLILLKVNAA